MLKIYAVLDVFSYIVRLREAKSFTFSFFEFLVIFCNCFVFNLILSPQQKIVNVGYLKKEACASFSFYLISPLTFG